MNKNQQEPKQKKNAISERIKDIEKLIIPRGHALIEIIDPYKESGSNLILPDGVDITDMSYFKVIKLGDEDFFKKLDTPEAKEKLNELEQVTKVGNIIITLKPTRTPILTHKNKEYLVVHTSSIECQVEPDNFSDKQVGTSLLN